MAKPRRKTLLAACVVVPGLVAVASQCPLNTTGTNVTGTGYSASCPLWDNQYETRANFLVGHGQEQWVHGLNAYRECSGDWVYTDQTDGFVWTTSMARSQFLWINNYRDGASAVYGDGKAEAFVWGS